MRYGLFVLPLALACAGTTATAPDQGRRLGAIAGFKPNDPNVTVVAEGRTVTVSVTTYGGGCESKGETEVTVEGLFAVVSPYDYTSTTTVACPDILKSFVHSTTIQFAGPGMAQITVRGLEGGIRTVNRPGDTLSVVRTVELR